MKKNGYIKTMLKEILEENNISIYRLSKMTGIKYDIIKRYCSGSCTRYDLYSLARICAALHCNVSDLLVYEEVEGYKEPQKEKMQ